MYFCIEKLLKIDDFPEFVRGIQKRIVFVRSNVEDFKTLLPLKEKKHFEV